MRYTIIGKEAGNWRLQRRKIVPLDKIHRIAYSKKLEEQIMLIEKIFKEIYSKMQNETGTDDLAMSDRLSVLLETPIEELDKERLELLLCSATIIGQEQGFISGFRFCIRLLAESLA